MMIRIFGLCALVMSFGACADTYEKKMGRLRKVWAAGKVSTGDYYERNQQLETDERVRLRGE